ncbi:MAG: response regulator [Pseudomonadota bacterium]
MTLLAEDLHWAKHARPVVLLVEDEVLIRLATADWLEDAGFEVVEAANGPEAMAAISAGLDFQALATDITMPGEPDGAGLVIAVRQLLPQMPIVVVSSILPPPIATVVDRFVCKPYSAADLVRAVRSLIQPAEQILATATES